MDIDYYILNRFRNCSIMTTTPSPAPLPQTQLKIRYTPFIVTIAIIVSFGSFNIGFSMVCITMLQQQIKQANSLENQQVQYYLSLATAMLPLGAIAGCFLLRFISKLGENRVLIITDYITIISSLILVYSLNIQSVCIGRFLIGISCGLSASIIPPYLISLSPLEWIGFMGSLHQLLITIGMGFAYLVGQKLQSIDLFHLKSWQSYLLTPIFYSLVRLVILHLFRFDSLQKYYENNNTAKLKQYMKLFYNKVDLQQLVKLKKFSKELVQSEQDKSQNKQNIVYLFGFPQKIFQISVAILILNQLSGINAILLYAKQLFMRISEYDQDKSNSYLLILGAIQILATLAGGWLSNEYGRKKTLINGGKLVTIVLFLVAVTYSWDQKQSKLLVILILAYIIGYAVSIGSTSMIYLAELLPDLSVVTMIYWGLTLLASLTSQIILNAFGISKTFLVFGLINVGCVWYMRSSMVQSKQKSRKQLVNEYLWDNKDVGDLQEYKIMSLSMQDNNSLIQNER